MIIMMWQKGNVSQDLINTAEMTEDTGRAATHLLTKTEISLNKSLKDLLEPIE